MKNVLSVAIMCMFTFCLTAQDITISFQPKVAGTKMDSILVINQRTNQQIHLAGDESLLLTQTVTGIRSMEEKAIGYLYPNPCYGDAVLSFSTLVNQDVELRIVDISGQVLAFIRQKLSPGNHTFKLEFPVSGIYAVSVLKEDEPLSFKSVYAGIQKKECSILYSGNENPTQLKKALIDRTLHYAKGDILLCTVFSGKNKTIVTDSPTATKIYAVDFFECMDPDKNNYAVVKIGSQVWMAENLKTTKYKDGSPLPNITDASAWYKLTTGAYCWYNNDVVNKATYGALYNGHAAIDSHNVCPSGWHVPGDAEWTSLSTYLGGEKVAGRKLKESGIAHWQSPNFGTFNESGFTGLPGGYFIFNTGFNYICQMGGWWSSTEYSSTDSWSRYLSFTNSNLTRGNSDKSRGLSVRCIRDSISTPTYLAKGLESSCSPDGTRIAFQNDHNLYVMNIDGSDNHLVVSKISSQPIWSPDSRYLMYNSQAGGNLYRIDADGKNPLQISDIFLHYVPSWSPDGKKIAFVVSNGLTSELITMNNDGTNISKNKAITVSVNPFQYPAWSADGSKILFSAGYDSDRDLYFATTDGTRLNRIKVDSLYETDAKFTSDGTKVLFLAQSKKIGNWSIYSINMDGTGILTLAKNVCTQSISLSVDRNTIVYRGYKNPGEYKAALYILSLTDFKTKMVLFPVTEVGNISLTPDNHTLIFDDNKVNDSGYNLWGVYSVEVPE
jgi:uncharacterized protein (TIGR02145 family)